MNLRQDFVSEVKQIIERSREQAIRSVDFARVQMNWLIGRHIAEEEQQGEDRAAYGKYLTTNLSKALQPEFGSGFGVRQLERYRQFYRLFPIASALRTQLGWTHYKLLLSIDSEQKREYYLEEATKNLWAARQLGSVGKFSLIANAVRSQLGLTQYALPEDNRQVFASKYQLYLPSEAQLMEEVRKEMRRVEGLVFE